MRNAEYTSHLECENAALGLLAIVAPPMRTKEKHGNAKRKRKVICILLVIRKGSSPHTFICPLPCYRWKAREVWRKERAVRKSRCKAAGRMKEAVGHKGSNCPYSSAVAPIVILDSDDDGDSKSSDESE